MNRVSPDPSLNLMVHIDSGTSVEAREFPDARFVIVDIGKSTYVDLIFRSVDDLDRVAGAIAEARRQLVAMGRVSGRAVAGGAR